MSRDADQIIRSARSHVVSEWDDERAARVIAGVHERLETDGISTPPRLTFRRPSPIKVAASIAVSFAVVAALALISDHLWTPAAVDTSPPPAGIRVLTATNPQRTLELSTAVDLGIRRLRAVRSSLSDGQYTDAIDRLAAASITEKSLFSEEFLYLEAAALCARGELTRGRERLDSFRRQFGATALEAQNRSSSKPPCRG